MNQFTFAHNNLNVFDLNKSLAFYHEALGLTEIKRKESDGGAYVIVFLSDGTSQHKLELTWLRDWEKPYELGDNEIHLALRAADYQAAHALHEKMGCICYENEAMGIYFIEDPDGYWIEILPTKR